MKLNEILEKIKQSNTIGITFHISPDGDSYGSSLGLLLSLRKLGKKVYIISKDKVSEIYSFLPGINEINAGITSVQEATDCVIALDCGNKERLNADIEFENRKYCLINIDHHLSNDNYGDINYVDTKCSAVGEIIYAIIKAMNIVVNQDIATCLYTSIITDCGSFKYSNTTRETHEIAAELITTGIDFSKIHRNIFENKNYERVKLYGKVIEKLSLRANRKLCVMELNNDMLKNLNSDISDSGDIISIGMEIGEIEVAVLFKESSDGTKVSLRSKNDFDVRKIAEFYGGGGHSKAAGLTINKPLDEAKAILIKHIEKELI
jgi:phosphoesterase RecJ-like protein